MKIRFLLIVTAVLLGVSALVAQTPLTPFFNLRAKTDATGALYITNGAAVTPDTPLTNLGNLRGKTDSTGALYVTCSGCGGGTSDSFCSTTSPTSCFTWNASGWWDLVVAGAVVGNLTGNGVYGGGNFGTQLSGNGVTLPAKTFASLGSVNNGDMRYCSDCTFANPCAGGGTGAIAKGLNSTWRCD